MLSERPRRRGSYAILWASSMMSIMGFGALAVDLTLVEFARGQTQDIADAAAQAAAITLRETADAGDAADVAARLVANNDVVGSTPAIDAVTVGLWDGTDFAADNDSPNAVEVTLAQTEPLLLAPLFGFTEFHISAGAVAAWQEVHAILVVDGTLSWSNSDFEGAKNACVAFYDMFVAAAQPDDRLGLTYFNGPMGFEYTPLQRVEDAEAGTVRADWTALKRASTGRRYHDGTGTYGNHFHDPDGGTNPAMPRSYRDELSTNHHVGVAMAYQMFDEAPDAPNLYQAIVINTDGYPNSSSDGDDRHDDEEEFAEGYRSNWRYYQSGVGIVDAPAGEDPVHGDSIGRDTVISRTEDIVDDMFVDDDIHTWIVSFVADDPWMEDIPRGNGYYQRVNDSDDMVPIYEDIARSFPMVLVR